MANQDAPFGFRAYRHLSGGTPGRTEEYTIADELASNIFTGDLVKPTGTGRNIDVATASDQILGVFMGCRYRDTGGNWIYANYWPTGTSTFQAEGAECFVVDDPDTLFIAQAAGDIAQADIGLFADLDNSTGGDTATGRSRMEVGAHASTEAGLEIVDIPLSLPVRDTNGNQSTNTAGTNALVVVRINEHKRRAPASTEV